MIFNTIEKQLRNHCRLAQREQQNSSINYSSSTNVKREVGLGSVKMSSNTNSMHHNGELAINLYPKRHQKDTRKSNKQKQKHEFVLRSSAENQKHPKNNHSYHASSQIVEFGLSNHIFRSEHNRNFQQIENQEAKTVRKLRNSGTTQNASISGCELYELSPLHFSKYLHFLEQQNDTVKALEKDRFTSIENRETKKEEMPLILSVHKIVQQKQTLIESIPNKTQQEITFCKKAPKQHGSIMRNKKRGAIYPQIYLLFLSGIVLILFELIK